ncbi:MAG TPA: O-antigen ligase family protein [Solirubrobacteraceae bacterium]|nr:O-antigen ligase family protein [Solirubrobacteraceae bacterium]
MSAAGAPAALEPSAQAREHGALPIWQGLPPEGGRWRRAAGSLRATAEPSARPRAGGGWPALLGAAILAGIAFGAGGGLGIGDTTYTEIAVTLASGTLIAALAAAVALGALPHPGRLYGIASALLLGAFAAFAALSVIWSVQPDASWIGAGHLFAYAAFFAGALALARIAPARCGAVLGAIAISSVVVCTYALLTKVFPGTLAAHETYARLQAPYGYWIATGLTAALGVIATLWAGARRDGHAALRILAYPALVIELVTLMLTYSRGPLAALLIGIACFILIVPLRLRTIALLGCATLAAAVPVAFAFASHALSSEHIPLPARSRAGHELGVIVVAALLAALCAGVALTYIAARRPLSERARRQLGAALVACLCALLLVLLGGLSASHRGLAGTISHDFSTLTNPNATPPANTPGRFTAVASVRARYWKEALEIFAAHPILGAGEEGYATARLRYRTDTLEVRQAHGFVVQVLADTGIIGALICLALLVAWAAAAGRATHPFNRRWRRWRWRALRDEQGHPMPYSGERIALLSLLCVVLTFGVHSFVDWTWYVPGDACVALLAAAWLAGRGPLAGWPGGAERSRSATATLALGSEAPAGARLRPGSRLQAGRRGAAALAGATLLLALLLAYTQWQPLRSAEGQEAALEALPTDQGQALARARAAVSADPLSASALYTLAAVQEARGEAAAAESTLRQAVSAQPANPQAWENLGEHDLAHGNYRAALAELRAAIYLNPMAVAPEAQIAGSAELVALHNAYVRALRANGI